MCERLNTIKCTFGLRSPGFSAYEIREWIYAQMCFNDQVATVAQIIWSKRHTHINFRDNERMQDVFYFPGGQVEYWHNNG